MGLALSGLIRKLFAKKQLRMLMVGLDGAGKTTVLYNLKFGEVIATIPTIGFNVETVQYKNVVFTVWDVGGQDTIRRLWRHYYQNTQGIIFVVDSTDWKRIGEAAKELHNMLKEQQLLNAVLLVLANKQDLPMSMTAEEVADKMQLNELRNRKWHVQGTCALKGSGLYEGFEWLSRELL